ncbi:MAG TPA: GTP cyclohydrolase I FolE [Anaeromyxobacteraceae bacterium]|nr:GTP cyclohydrolase I FolE [Anaeromyxobacteraceae bacterium]
MAARRRAGRRRERNAPDVAAAARAVDALLRAVVPAGDLRRADVRGTPRRVAEALRDDLLDGYRSDPSAILSAAMEHPGRDLVAVTGIDFHSMCPHHLLPYRGTATVAYVPGGRVVGFGVLARLVDSLAHRLVIQEVLARQVAEALVDHLGARGAACVLEAEQSCLTVRGERRRGARAHAQAFAGVMADDAAWQRRVLGLAAGSGPAGPRRRA